MLTRRGCVKIMNAKTFAIRLLRDRRGATAVEYGLILVMIVIAMLSALNGVADETTSMWDEVTSKSQEAHDGAH